jgi:citrate synthase
MEPWLTAITTSDETHVWTRGYDVAALMTGATFTDIIFLFHQERLPTQAERKMMDAILVAVSNDGPNAPSAAAARVVTSGNRRSIESAIAAGVLAIGDVHGGASTACMQEIVACRDLMRRESISIQEAADLTIAEALAQDRRIPGLGGGVNNRDPRANMLFSMAQECGLVNDSIAILEALEKAASEHIRPLPINLEGAIAAVLSALGFYPAMASVIFIIGRVAGLTAEVMEERRREKPMHIRIPVTYDGPPPRPLQ